MDCVRLVWCSIALLVSTELCARVSCEVVNREVETPLRIGGFNIQNLGVYKLSNDEVMDTVKKVILRYDILLIQEIVTQDHGLMTKLLRAVNSLAKDGAIYDMKLSERLGRRSAKEQYGYFFRRDKVIVLNEEVFPDTEDDFMRPPYIGQFSTPTVDNLQSFVMIGIHTQPSNAANETSSLAQVYEYVKQKYETNNAVILGDMNAGCATVRKSDWNKIDLWTDPAFEWLIGHDVDTTTGLKSCPYDRIVIAGDDIKNAIVPKSAGIFNFQEEYGLTEEQTKSVSDHWPVEVRLKGKLSEEARKSLTSSVCFEVRDSRQVIDPMAIHRARKKFDFKTSATKDDNGNYAEMTATRSSDDLGDLISAFKNLANKFPNVVYQESMQAVQYKAMQGALDDISSYSQLDDALYHMEVRCYVAVLLCYITTCRDTTIN